MFLLNNSKQFLGTAFFLPQTYNSSVYSVTLIYAVAYTPGLRTNAMAMKKRHILFILCLTALMPYCKKDPPIEGGKFVPGEILVGITPETELKSVFAFFNGQNFFIKQVTGFNYLVPIGADSVNGFKAFLNNKTYINAHGFHAYAFYLEKEASVKNGSIYFDMNLQNQNDLISCLESGKWRDNHEEFKNLYMNIPRGTEYYWLAELKKYPFVKWVELNEYIEVHPN